MERDNKGRFIKGHKQLNSGRTHIKKGSQLRLGAKHSEESKKKMSETHKRMEHNITGLQNYVYPRGKNHWAWKGGVDESKLCRRSAEYIKWRLSVFERDLFTCQKCREKGGRLHPHHIYSFSEHKEQRFDLENGITFCEKCHRKFHKIYGKKNINKQQIEDYVSDNKASE